MEKFENNAAFLRHVISFILNRNIEIGLRIFLIKLGQHVEFLVLRSWHVLVNTTREKASKIIRRLLIMLRQGSLSHFPVRAERLILRVEFDGGFSVVVGFFVVGAAELALRAEEEGFDGEGVDGDGFVAGGDGFFEGFCLDAGV